LRANWRDTYAKGFAHYESTGTRQGGWYPVLPHETAQVTQTWDPSLTARDVAAGKHVYVFAELQSKAGQELALDPVRTGTPVPELYLLVQRP
jgi:hypothetical protein